MRRFGRIVLVAGSWAFSLGITACILVAVTAFALYQYYSQDLPDYTQLAEYNPPTVTRLYAADGRVLAEYATEKRVFVPLKAIPKRVRQAFISAEDKNFYRHTGIDFTGIVRAVRNNIVNYGKGRSLVGGSTITQQVVKNFLLTNEKSIERKIKEAIIALRISRIYSKDKILELYLNEIYLGLGSYGVAAAAQNYFNKSMDELTLEEAALLAAQPKAPSSYDPRRHYERARKRRDWIIERMREDGVVTKEEADAARAQPIVLHGRDPSAIARADFFAEEVRRWLTQNYGAEVLYEGGLVVKTTLDPQLQQYADAALREALIAYDRRRGYRGPVAQVEVKEWKERLAEIIKKEPAPLLEHQKLAVVTSLDSQRAHIAFADGSTGTLPMKLLKWTRRVLDGGTLAPEPKTPSDVLHVGDVVLAGPVSDEQKKLLSASDRRKAWDLQQVPKVNGAFVVLDPHTGRVLAMSGGYAYGSTEFNRVTQAKRQPGSAFKPFVYLAGLENGFTPSTIIMDAPIELSQGEGLPLWAPQNYGGEFLGPVTMRVGLEKSRNTMTVRMSQIVGIRKIMEMGRRFGIYDEVPRNFSIVLGAAETTLLRLATAYGIIANGGRRIAPSLIERIDDRNGKTVYWRDDRSCGRCLRTTVTEADLAGPPPFPQDEREQVIDPRLAYQMISMLQGVVTRGTGVRAQAIGKIVAGKTGTTNDSVDAWFVGFTPDLVAGVYVGFDQPRSLGAKETGSSVALPAFVSFMQKALENAPNRPFEIPRGIQLTRVDRATGLPVNESTPIEAQVIEEAFVTRSGLYIPGVTPWAPMDDPALDLPPDDGAPPPADVGSDDTAPPPLPAIMPPSTTSPAAPGTGGLY